MSDPRAEKMRRELEEHGEAVFRKRLRSGMYGPESQTDYGLCVALLEELDRTRTAEARDDANRQGEEVVEQAREANRIASEANKLAKAANETAEEAKVIAEEVKEDAKWHTFGLALSVAIALAALAKSFFFD